MLSRLPRPISIFRLINILTVLLLLTSGCKKATPSSLPIPSEPEKIVQYGTPFNQVPDTRDAVLYEVNIGAYSSTAKLEGITARLDSIKALGINVIWLMPTYPIGKLKSIGSPYCVQDYLKVNPNYGSLDNLRELVSQAHSKGIAVILDWVADHTAWDNPWISNKAWYQQDENGNIISPPGTTWTDVAALNYNNNDMRKAMISAMKYWVLTANIDGYRCDDADAIPTDFWIQAIDTLKSTGHKLVMLAEGNRAGNLSSGFDMNYGWNYYNALLSVFGNSQANASALGIANSADNNALQPEAYILRFIDNHDEDNSGNTPLTAFNNKAGSLAAFTLAAYMGGVPLIYSGQEVGISVSQSISKGIPINWNNAPDLLATYKKLIGFRNSSSAVKAGSVTLFDNPDVVVFERISGADEVLVIVNTRNRTVNYSIPAALQNSIWDDALSVGSTFNFALNLNIQPYTFLVLKKHSP